MRRLYLLLIVLGVLAFFAVSALLARAWGAEGGERSAITTLVTAEARGDAAAVTRRWQGCAGAAACRGRAAALARRLERPGTVAILQLQPSTGFSLGSTTGVARVAWDTSQRSLPVVQCVKVHRAGNVLRGLSIELLAVTPPIRSDADCPRSV